MATYTATTVNQPPKRNHVGNQTVNVVVAQTLAVGDVIQFCKLPDRALLIDAVMFREKNGGDINISAGGTILLTSTASGAVRMSTNSPDNIGMIVSVSATNPVKYHLVTGTVASASITGTLKLQITYTMDHPDSDQV